MIGFVYLSIDEATEIHVHFPRLDGYRRGSLSVFAWTTSAVAILVVLGLTFLPFLLRLPPDTRRRFLVSGAVFVAGAVGMEMVSGGIALGGGRGTLRWEMVTTIEETLELVGIRLFGGALLAHIAAEQATGQADAPSSLPLGGRPSAASAGAAQTASASSTGR